MASGHFPIVHCCYRVGCSHRNVGNPHGSPAQMRHETPVCTDPCFRNVSYSRRCRSSRSVIVADRNFGHVERQRRRSKDRSCSLAAVRPGNCCCTRTCRRIDRFADSDHHGLVCNHGPGPVDNQDIAPGQYCPLPQLLKRLRMPVRDHPIFYSSNSLVLIPPCQVIGNCRARQKQAFFLLIICEDVLNQHDIVRQLTDIVTTQGKKMNTDKHR